MLLFAHVAVQATSMTLEKGFAFNTGARDGATPVEGIFAGRADRALKNYLETYPAFVALALGLVASGHAGGAGAQGAVVWIVARAAYVPLYLAGVPYVRTLAYAAAAWGLWRMFEQLMWP